MAISGDDLRLSRRISGLELPEGLLRQPRRPVELRQEGFDQLFDYGTLLYDAVLVPEDQTVVLTCPPAFNLQTQWQTAQVVDPASGTHLNFELIELDLLLRVVVRGVSAQTTSLEISFAGQRFVLDVRDTDSEAFRDRKALMTVSKDNEISWIEDWARYHAHIHGIDSVLLLDNNSQKYPRNALLERLVAVPGISLVHVVEWPFLWGPTAAASGLWDSNFGQLGAFEVCRWRFLRNAALVLNTDIDELVVPRTSSNLFEHCTKSNVGAANFGGRWVVGVEGVTPAGDEHRHRDFFHVLPRTSPLSMSKWALQPKRTRNVRQWAVHRLRGLSGDPYTEDFELGHFREISTNWKWQRHKRSSASDTNVTVDQGILDVYRRMGWLRNPS